MKNLYFKIKSLIENQTVFIYLLSAILITIPLNFAFGSITCILFLLVSFSSLHILKFVFNKALILPILLYIIMILSLLWTRDFKSTLSGLQKESLFLFLPLAFLVLPELKKDIVNKTFRIYSFGMMFYTIYYFINALFRYFYTGDREVFFFHELVTVDLNAIYMAAFASFAMFYFISIKNKLIIDRIALFVLIFFVFLLSSKSVFLIDLLLIIYYYIYISKTPKGVKALTIISITFFLIFSISFVSQVRERFLLEYETAFVDNTINEDFGNKSDKVYNVSLNQAWYNDEFGPKNFFPGTALRVFQVRIFKEMLQEQNIFLTGFGLEASQDQIIKKITQHKLFLGYSIFNFHNQYVQTFAELGCFGFLILILMLYINIKNAWQHKNFLHIVFALTMIILFLTESIFCRQRGVVFFITLYCIFNSRVYRKEEMANSTHTLGIL